MIGEPSGPFEAVLFDLDGVCVDSEPVQVEAWRRAVEASGGQFDPALIHSYWGRPIAATAAGLAQHLQVDTSRLEAARDRAFEALTETGVPIMPSLPEAIRRVQEHGLRSGLVTSGGRDYAASVLAALGRDHGVSFEVVVTRDDVENPKPDPEPYLLGARLLQVDPAACVVLEDAPAGVASAKAAGMTVVAIPTEYTRGLDLSQADSVQPDLVGGVEWLLDRA
jgi:HAD superfamily hydrolase (TIGR01509 family)